MKILNKLLTTEIGWCIIWAVGVVCGFNLEFFLWVLHINYIVVSRGFSSSGRAPPCQGGGSEFKSRNPLQWRCSQEVRHGSATP